MCRPARGSLQLDARPSDPFPERLPVEIAAFEHQIGALCGFQFGISAMLPNEQIRNPPSVEVRDHPYFFGFSEVM